MKLNTLRISLEQPYSDPGPNNPYVATLEVSYNNNSMKVRLSGETCTRILALAGDEIAAAAQVQISDFVKTAIAVSSAPAIEGQAV